MAREKKIEHYRDRFNKNIKICLACNHVEILDDAKYACPTCGEEHQLAFWPTAEKFRQYLQLYKPTDLNPKGEEVIKIVEEELGSDAV